VTDALPPIDSSLLPADVRSAGPEARELYTAALGFEQLLLEQLAAGLGESAFGDGEDEPGLGGASAMYRQLLPGALAEGLAASGGIGLARGLYDSLVAPAAADEAEESA
jgi:Rod binding domain-containing protein